jgi:hypothetical protein
LGKKPILLWRFASEEFLKNRQNSCETLSQLARTIRANPIKFRDNLIIYQKP